MVCPLFLLSLSFLIAGCAGKPTPPPVVQPPPLPPPPKGDLLRLGGIGSAPISGKVSIRIENEALDPAKTRRGGKLMRAFLLTEEHSLVGVEQDGTQHIAGRLLDVEGKTDNPREQKNADKLAQALSEIKITFDRSPRGEVTKLDIQGVREPLDAGTARIVAGSIYGAGRGYVFPEKHVEVGSTWKVATEVPIPAGGVNNLEIEYTYVKKEGSVAFISFAGKSTGESQGAQLTGDLKGELRFDTARGDFLSFQVDTKAARDPGPAGNASVLRVHVEWEAVAPGATLAPAGQPEPAPPAEGSPKQR